MFNTYRLADVFTFLILQCVRHNRFYLRHRRERVRYDTFLFLSLACFNQVEIRSLSFFFSLFLSFSMSSLLQAMMINDDQQKYPRSLMQQQPASSSPSSVNQIPSSTLTIYDNNHCHPMTERKSISSSSTGQVRS